jgi:hypothetical protein
MPLGTADIETRGDKGNARRGGHAITSVRTASRVAA